MSVEDLFPPGTDLCQITLAVQPTDSQQHGVESSEPLKTAIIALTVIFAFFSIVFTLGRLYTNFRKLSCADGFVFVALVVDVAAAVLMCAFARFSRHMWDIPLCWPLVQYMKFKFAFEILTAVGLFLAKAATLILFGQVFTVSTTMRWAIRLGHLINFLVYFTSFVVWSYSAAPHVGQSWLDLAVKTALDPDLFEFRYAEAQAPVVLALDLYIFVLPLPIICGLNTSTKKRFRLIIIFGTAIIGIVACSVNLAYRVIAVHNDDKTFLGAIIFTSTQVEMSAAIIVASMPAFSQFFRAHVWNSTKVSSLRRMLGFRGTNPEEKHRQDPNQPRTGMRKGPWPQDQRHRYELDENWLMDTAGGADTDVESSAFVAVPARAHAAHA